MNRREFLKSLMAAAVAAIILYINECEPARQTAKPVTAVSDLPTGKTVFGGNLFTAYARGRYSVDGAEVRV